LLARSDDLQDVTRAVRLAPGNARYWVALANLEDGTEAGGEDALDRARKLNPYDPAIWIQAGLRAEARGKAAQAETFLLALPSS